MARKTFHLLMLDNDEDDALLVRLACEEFNRQQSDLWVNFFFSDTYDDIVSELDNCQRSGRAGVLLLDIKMPGQNGINVLKALKSMELTSHFPVVMYTSSTAEADIRDSLAAHANAYVVKAGCFDELCIKMQQMLRFFGLVNHAA